VGSTTALWRLVDERIDAERLPRIKKTFGFHPPLVFLDRLATAAGEALAGSLRAGNVGSNTTADHITVLGQALASLPSSYRPGPSNPRARRC
jgi:hypothetical protein